VEPEGSPGRWLSFLRLGQFPPSPPGPSISGPGEACNDSEDEALDMDKIAEIIMRDINTSRNLFQRLQKVRDKEFNVSMVCREGKHGGEGGRK
jgi:hypothetical protein